MKAYYLIAPLAATALVGCTVYRPVAVEPMVTTAPTVAYVTPPSTTVVTTPALVTDPALIDSDGDGYSNAVDRFPNDPRYH
jgi:hypothetical protein